VLGSFLFRGDDVFKKVSLLSGGEKSRLALVKLLMDPPNLLLMDEPTTHLDMASIEALIAALEQYRGTIIFISHDVYFIKAIADHVVRVQDGELRQFPAPYQYYVDKMAEEQKVAAGFQTPSASARPAPVSQANRKEQRRLEAAERQAKSKVKRKQQEIVKALEARIASLEKRQAELVALLEDPGSYEKDGGAAGYNRELAVGQRELIKLTAEWEAESEKLTAL